MDTQIDAIIKRVSTEINGRFANAGNAAKHLLQAVKDAGDGNYLEIGVLHGGSLCAVALLKQALKHKGVCVGVDPFSGWYFDRTGKIEDNTGVPVTMETAMGNIQRFNLKNVILASSKSADFSTNLRFAVSYIDGAHEESAVFADWLKVKEITDKFVVFHDYGLLDSVTASCDRAAKDEQWAICHKGAGFFILRRK